MEDLICWGVVIGLVVGVPAGIIGAFLWLLWQYDRGP